MNKILFTFNIVFTASSSGLFIASLIYSDYKSALYYALYWFFVILAVNLFTKFS